MDAKTRSILYGVAILSAALVWATCCPAEEVGVFINGQPVGCRCADCQCGPTCQCAAGQCRCPGCQVAAEAPVTVVLYTASWCGPCHAFHPTFARVSASSPVPMEERDFDEHRAEANRFGVTRIPSVVVVQGDRLIKRYRAGGMAQGQLEAVVQEAGTK
jgi:thioredoxin 1